MRLFCAIDLSDEMKGALTELQDDLRSFRIRGNYTKRENFHITLAFIGEYKDAGLVVETLEKVRFKPFDISLDGLGSFGSLWWAGLSQSDSLANLARRVRHVLSDADIPFDRKRFSPHITLIREPNADLIPGMTVPDIGMTVRRFSLFRSDRGKNGMIYTELHTVTGDR